ncbi:uncharacterized protein [Tenebrio molitor]|uniref:uncharacterized protein isoform X1 n=1 Tax=Tenebrio molitor TaxID=7067 RepID=UPI003624905B
MSGIRKCRHMDDPNFRDRLLRAISKADDIRVDYVNNNKIGVTSIRRLLENLYVRWRRGKAEEKVEDYLIKHLKSSTKRQSYIEKIEAFRLQGEATHEVPLNVPLEPINTKAHDLVEPGGETDHVPGTSGQTQVAQPEPGTSRPNKRKRKGDELLLLEAKRFLGASWEDPTEQPRESDTLHETRLLRRLRNHPNINLVRGSRRD